MSSKPLMLWIDCTSGMPDPEHRVRCAGYFEIAQAEGIDCVSQAIARHKPSVLCFDFDYPDQRRLEIMRSIKRTHSRLPILMLTLEHSEQLAVWAFRARAWNYLVKPVAPSELADNLQALASLGHRATPPRMAQFLATTAPEQLPPEPLTAEVAQLQPGLSYVTRHYHERITASMVARACGLGRFDFSRRFRAAFGMTFRAYLLRARINEARRLLVTGHLSITGVAYSVGFNDGSHFARMFKRFTGMLPSDYRVGDLARLASLGRRATDREQPSQPVLQVARVLHRP
jgi:AraC-like DNA-binding protein